METVTLQEEKVVKLFVNVTLVHILELILEDTDCVICNLLIELVSCSFLNKSSS